MTLRLKDIVVGDRRREDMGDVEGLAESIKRHGLLHPVVVDAQKRLVAGARRLRACAPLGWEDIPIRQLGNLTEQELRLLELEENVRRKDLTEYEKSRAMVAYIETAEEVLREAEPDGEAAGEFLPDSGKNSRGRGRPSKPDSQAKMSEYTGIPQQRVSEAKSHVALADRFPFMQTWPQYRVLEAGEYVVKLPDSEHGAIIKLLNQPAIPPDNGSAWPRYGAIMPWW